MSVLFPNRRTYDQKRDSQVSTDGVPGQAEPTSSGTAEDQQPITYESAATAVSVIEQNVRKVLEVVNKLEPPTKHNEVQLANNILSETKEIAEYLNGPSAGQDVTDTHTLSK